MKQTRETECKDSFDVRIVRYEYIHSIKARSFDELVKLVNPNSGETILDAGCGYGSVTREILKRNRDKKLNCILADSSATQLARARAELASIGFEHGSDIRFFKDNLVDTKLENGTFDTVVAKMLIHEIPVGKQQDAIDNAHAILKSGGRLIIWDMTLDKDTQRFIQDIFRMKDKLAGFHSLEINRYFLRFDEIEALLAEAGFKDVRRAYTIASSVVTKKRLKQEFGGSKIKLNQWHDFIRARADEVDSSVLKCLKFKDDGDRISFTPPKAIITAVK